MTEFLFYPLLVQFTALETPHGKFIAVYDGHGNSLIAEILQSTLHKYIFDFVDTSFPLTQSIKKAFTKLDEEILNFQRVNSIDGGSTALITLKKTRLSLWQIVATLQQ